MENVPILRVEHVGKAYNKNRVLKDISFTLNKGSILGLVGENGAGKSTLMNILFGMKVITDTGGYEGKIFVDGQEILFLRPKDALSAGIGMVHQEFSLIPGFTVTENILLNRESLHHNIVEEVFGQRLATLNRDEMKERAEHAISLLNIDLDSETLISELPVGHKQFVEIAREISSSKTRILVLDEPTAVLTETEADILLDSMRNLANTGIAIIFISHRLDEVLKICDKIIVLRDGEVVLDTQTGETSVRGMANAMVGRQTKNIEATKSFNRSATPILEVDHLWVDMPGETVRDVNLQVMQGEIYGISGLAGQGKLGIANGIMGLMVAGGSVKFEGKPLCLNNPKAALEAGLTAVSEDRRGVGLLLEESIEWNIIFEALQNHNAFLKPILGGLINIRDEEKISECARKYIKDLEIRCVSEKQKILELSGGNQQKVCLAKAFETKPKLLFVAEPTRGIDVGAKILVLETLRKYNRENGMTIIMISSELEELRTICDRIAITDRGTIAGVLPASAPSEDFGLLMMGKADQVTGNVPDYASGQVPSNASNYVSGQVNEVSI